MRKTKRFTTILLMMILLGGCGNSGVSQEEYDNVVAERDTLKNESQESDKSTESANEVEEIPDLSGNWEQEGKGDSYQAGYISDDVIEIYWITDDSKALYWSGSYEAPTEKTDSFSWESKSDKEKTGTALLASLDDSKIFTYDSGKISYEVTVQGVTQTIKLIPTDTDYSENQFKTSEKETESTGEETELNVIASEKYKVDGEDVGIVLSEKNGTLDISIIGHANTEEKASIMLATYINELEKLISLDSYSVCAFYGEQFATYSKNSDGKTSTYGANADGSIAFSAPDWLKTEITMPEDEADLYISDLLERLTEFSESMSSDSADSKGEIETETQEKSSELQENDSENPYWTYFGSGDDIVTGFNSTKSFSIAHIVNDGNGHFAVKAHYDNKYDLLVNTTELYDGMTLIYPQKEYTFEVTSRGDWKIEVYEMGVSTAEEFSGNGDFVTPIFLKDTNVYEISAKGKGHFAVKGWTDSGYQLLVNTADEDYSGKVMFKDKEKYAFFEITASGEWKISPVK